MFVLSAIFPEQMPPSHAFVHFIQISPSNRRNENISIFCTVLFPNGSPQKMHVYAVLQDRLSVHPGPPQCVRHSPCVRNVRPSASTTTIDVQSSRVSRPLRYMYCLVIVQSVWFLYECTCDQKIDLKIELMAPFTPCADKMCE